MNDRRGAVAVVTGANSGVGFSATKLLSDAGADVVMICRSEARGRAAREAILEASSAARVDLEIADIGSLKSVRSLAGRIAGSVDGIDLLVNNAGVYRARREISADGLEVTLATNHLGHFLLTRLLLDRLRARRGCVINVSSNGHRRADLRRASLEDIVRGKGAYDGVRTYGDSKLANVLFSFELARRHGDQGIRSNAVHPGVLRTRIWNQNRNWISLIAQVLKPLMGKAEVGGKAIARFLTEPALRDVSGRYFDIEDDMRAIDDAYDEALAAELWNLSERLVADFEG